MKSKAFSGKDVNKFFSLWGEAIAMQVIAQPEQLAAKARPNNV